MHCNNIMEMSLKSSFFAGGFSTERIHFENSSSYVQPPNLLSTTTEK